MIKNYSTFINERKVNLNCIDCGKHAEAFFVKNPIWYDNVPKTKQKGVMCINCLEKRMGRKLIKSDFMTGGTGDIHPDQSWWSSISESYIYDYQLDNDDIGEIFVELSDEGYNFDLSYGFLNDEQISSGSLETVEIPLLANKEYHPAYHIYITSPDNESKRDLTDSLLTMIEYLESDYKVLLYADGLTSKEYITVKDGEFLVDDFDLKDNCLNIFLVSENINKIFTEVDIAKYYNFKNYETIGDKIFIDVEIEDMADMTVSNRCVYKKYLADHVDDTDYYSDYRPSMTDLFGQLLTDENADALLKNMLEDYDGDYLKEQDIDFKSIKSDWHHLNNLRNELCGDILNMYSDWELQDQFYKNVQEVKDSFNKKLEEDFEYKIVKEEREKSYMIGGEEKKYTDSVTVYRIYFDNFLIDSYDREDIYNWDAYDLLREYCANNISYELNPRFSDYGNVDYKEFNQEVASMLK